MKRFLFVFVLICIVIATVLCGCEPQQIDRGSELKQVMDTCDSKWSQAFPTGTATFDQISDYIAGWGGNAGLDVTKKSEHYLVLTNPATKGKKKVPSVALCVSVDPSHLRDCVSLLSLGMTNALGPMEHGKIRLIVTESNEDGFPGADSISSKYMNCDHFIHLYRGSSAMVYTAGPMSALGTMSFHAPRKSPSYSNAYKIHLTIPENIDPYSYDKASSLPNPINVVGDLLASAKSSGRLFEIASFTAKDNGDFLPCEATAVVVIDDNNVEAFQKRFNTSFEAFQKRFGELELSQNEDGETTASFQYTMEETKLPKKVLRQSAGDNIISLMYTLQTGIHLQDEDTGAITAASYIRSVSTADGEFSLIMDMRSRDSASMEEMSGNYLITSGLCDVRYKSGEPKRLWTAVKESSLAAWFTATVNDAEDDPIRIQSSECDHLYSRGDHPDLISYRYDKDHRDTALENFLSYSTSLATQE